MLSYVIKVLPLTVGENKPDYRGGRNQEKTLNEGGTYI